jgi:hypothetical protein
MDDLKIKELRLILRGLADYLKAQHEAMGNCLLTVAALRKTVNSHTDLRVAYKANLHELSEDETFQAGLSSANTLEILLRKLTDW